MSLPLIIDNAMQFAHWDGSNDRFILRDVPTTTDSIAAALARETPNGESVNGQQTYLKAVYRDTSISSSAAKTRELFIATYDSTGQGTITRTSTLHSSNAGNPVVWPENTDIVLYSVLPSQVINRPVIEDTVLIGTPGAPAFKNGWQNFGSGFLEAGFYKTGDRVYLQGLIKSGTLAQTIFELPEGYRPASRILFSTMGASSAARLDVLPDGSLVTQHPTVNNAWLSLDGLSFRVA